MSDKRRWGWPVRRATGGSLNRLPVRFVRRLAALAPDVLPLGTLLVALALPVVFLAATPPTTMAFGMDRYPPSITFRNFYGIEMNTGGAYRWAKPQSVISFPVAAPATYRLTLTLGDSPAAPPRPVTVYINGMGVGQVVPVAAPREFTFTYALPAAAWASSEGHGLTIELQTPPFVPSGDQRALGVLLTRVAVTPLAAPPSAGILLYALSVAALATLYTLARVLGVARLRAVVLGALIVLALLVLSVRDRTASLWVLAQPTRGPALFLGALLLALALGFLARSALRADPTGASGGTAPGPIEYGDVRVFWSRRSLPLVPVMATAAGLRAFHLQRLNLWFDEGATIHFARLPWTTVLGLRGVYEPHPPLYYSAVKLIETIVPVAVAGRALSAFAGTLTVAVLYALATRLLGRDGGLVAAIILALSPLHLWYSQEARMYAPSVLFVALAALALVAFAQATGQRARWGWAGLYGLSVLSAMYTVYSAFYPLAAQLVILGFLLRRQGRRLVPLAIALGAALLAYLPWLPQMRAGVAGLSERSGALGPTPTRALDTMLALTGLGGIGLHGESFYPGLWEDAVAWRVPALLLIAPALALGCAALARRGALAMLTTGVLLVGTFVVAVVSSLYSPGFAPRTLLYATLGWALVAGAATLVQRPRWVLVLARASLVGLLLVSGVTLRTMATGAEKQHYRAVVADATVAATFGLQVVAIGYMAPFFDAYAPELRYEGRPFLTNLTADTGPPALWLAYGEDPWEDMPTVRAHLAALGFARLSHRQFGDTLYLDLFARRDAPLGAVIPLTVDFDPTAGWQLPSVGATRSEVPGAIALTLVADGDATPRASLLTDGGLGGLYTLDVGFRAQLTGGKALASLACLDGAGGTLSLASSESPLPTDSATLRVATWCPSGTERLRLDLDNRGTGTVTFQDVRLRLLPAIAP